MEHKNFLFNDYYKIPTHNQQSTYLLGLIQAVNVQRRRHGAYGNPEGSRRQCTVYYTVPDGNGVHIQVCRKTYSEIFDLSHKRVQVLTKKKQLGHTVYVDKRGAAKKPRKYFPELREQIRAHIELFPIEENHYSRKKSEKKFLSPDLNMNRLYIAFKKKYPKTIASYRYFCDTFKKDFPNLRFGRPRSDTCSNCDLYQNKIRSSADPVTKAQFRQKLECHQRKAERARTTMKEDDVKCQEPTSINSVISIDLEQVLFIPALTHTQMFYSRQLSCYNLGIHISDNSSAHMCLWNESITGRGGNEISSAILKVLEGRSFPFKKNLIIWSDNCIGQNKNRMLLFLMIYLVATGKFDSIQQKFLISGHSYLACDRDFAQIEKRKRVTKTFVPNDIEKMITEARHNNPFVVHPLERPDFKDFQKACDSILNTTKLNIASVCWIQISKECPTKVKTKKTFNDMEEWTICNVLKKGQSLNDIKNIQIPQLQCKNKISAEKLKNLEDMLDYIPLIHLPFYENLIQQTRAENG